MSVKTILFDLDGSLLPVDQDIFVREYFKGLVSAMLPLGSTPEELTEMLWTGIRAMMKNDGSATNEQVFWSVLNERLGEDVGQYRAAADRFYAKEYGKISAFCGHDSAAEKTVRLLKEKGSRERRSDRILGQRVQ